jgi:hypothetical protein
LIAALLLLAGLALVLLAALAPDETLHLQATLAPTLLTPPPGGMP